MPRTNDNQTSVSLRRGRKPQSASSNRLVNRELKTLDFTQDIEANTSGQGFLLNGIVPGVGVNQRVGRQVLMKRLELTVQNSARGGTGVDQYHRVMVVRDRQSNGIQCTLAQVLEFLTVTSFYDVSYQFRFQILVDQRVYLPGAVASNGRFQKIWSRDVPLNFIEQFTIGTSGAIGDIITNSIYVFVLGSAASGTTSGQALVTARLSYTDA